MKNSYIARKFRNIRDNRMVPSLDINKYSDLIDFGYGDPDFTTDKRITEKTFIDALAGHTHYTDDAGDLELRQEISKYYKDEFNHDVNPNEFMISTGSSHGMWLTVSGILDQGDEVIIPTPHYSTYLGQVEITGAKPVFLPLYEKEGFQIDVKRLERLINYRTKAIILNSPHNPTGSIINRKTLMDIAAICEKHDLLIIADEVYSNYNYEEEFIPIRTLNNMKKRTITLGSFSKDYAMTGWRIGYILAEDYMVDVFKYINEFNVFTAPSVSQRAALHALRLRQEVQPGLRNEFKKRLTYGYHRLKKMKNIRIIDAQGSFFLFPNIQETGLSSEEVAKILLEQAHVLVIPGTAFGKAGKGHLRFACTVDIEKMREGFNRMERLSIFR